MNTAGAAAGNTVLFSPGPYTLTATVNLPCANGTLYTGPSVGIVTQSNLPTVILTNTSSKGYLYGLAFDLDGADKAKDVTNDGKRFLVNRYVKPASVPPLNIVLHATATEPAR